MGKRTVPELIELRMDIFGAISPITPQIVVGRLISIGKIE
jgi:hypothetical protein